MTRSERIAFWALTALAAVTRWPATAKTLWDWDEALFMLALRDYDVVAHHPHPPGFPVFIAAAKLLSGLGEFHALQAIVLLGAIALFPLMFWVARELGMPFVPALCSALVLVFLPNVWFYGGTAFSDVPSLAMVLLAIAMLLRGRTSAGAYVAGAFLLGVAAGIRPQNLFVGLFPALWATWCRVRATRSLVQPLVAAVIGALTIVAAYGGAVLATGSWDDYAQAVSRHRAYIAAYDSFRSPIRPPLMKVFDDFFLRPFRNAPINVAICVLGILALIGRRKPLLYAGLIFGPFWVAGYLMLDFWSVSRFSIAWMPLVALAIADGSSTIAFPVRRRFVEVAIPAALVVAMAVWTLPGLAIVHRNASPTVRATQWCRTGLPQGAAVQVHGSMAPFNDLLLGADAPPLWPDDRNTWLLREGNLDAPCARRFSYPHEPLWNIARPRYFEVSVVPVRSRVRFGEGWYGEERATGRSFRWMSGRGVLQLEPGDGRKGQLTLQGRVPLDAMSGTPTITIMLDGAVLERFVATQPEVERVYTFESRKDRPRTLEIRFDRVGHTPSDGRDLALRLDAVTWSEIAFDCAR